MKKQKLTVTTKGSPSIDAMSVSQQKTFYISLLACVLDKRKQQLETQNKS